MQDLVSIAEPLEDPKNKAITRTCQNSLLWLLCHEIWFVTPVNQWFDAALSGIWFNNENTYVFYSAFAKTHAAFMNSQPDNASVFLHLHMLPFQPGGETGNIIALACSVWTTIQSTLHMMVQEVFWNRYCWNSELWKEIATSCKLLTCLYLIRISVWM